MIRVLIADDQALVRAGFRVILDAQPDIRVVAEAADGVEAVRRAEVLRPDVIVMDIRMPDVDGIDATRRLTEEGSPSRVLILTTFDLDEYVYESLRAGASGFLLKNSPPEELVAAVRTIAGGDCLLAPEVTRRLIADYVRRPARMNGTPPRLAELTERELEVLRSIARGLSNAEIATELFLSEATVKTHVNRLLGKLGIRDRTQAVILAYESGFISPGD